MSNNFIVICLLSSFAFITYGLLCLTTNHMKEEFERYRMSHMRSLTGFLEVLGGIGLLAGFWVPLMMKIASLCLCLLMLAGIIVRLSVKDRFILLTPAFILLFMNAYIFYYSYNIT